jgi:hypothetical protein
MMSGGSAKNQRHTNGTDACSPASWGNSSVWVLELVDYHRLRATNPTACTVCTSSALDSLALQPPDNKQISGLVYYAK